MFLGDCWKSIDGVQFWEAHQRKILSGDVLEKLCWRILQKYTLSHTDYSMDGYCSWAGVIMRTSNWILENKEYCLDKVLCSMCRGKGHSWSCAIWNGLPYNTIKTEFYPRGQAPSDDEWKTPAWCYDCGGSGIQS